MQRPIHTRLGAIAGGTQKSGKSHRHFAEQRRDPVRPPVLHVASPAAGTAIRTKPPMLIGLTRSDRSLNARQKQLRLGKAQAQVRDLPKAFRPADLNQVSAPRDGIIACLDQPHHPPHRSSSSRSLNRLVVPILSASPHTPNLWTVPLLAARSSPSHAEQEALRIRRDALEGAQSSLAFARGASGDRYPARRASAAERKMVAPRPEVATVAKDRRATRA